jgi:outer membrane murein-binding lipoprotein Lpp
MNSKIKAVHSCAAFLLTSLLLSGCTSNGMGSSHGDSNLQSLNAQLNTVISNNECTASFQCKVLEVGARACGGPSKYVVYSTLNTKQDDAEAIAKKITTVEKSQNTTLAECLPVLPIQSLCLAKQCQAIDIK